MIIILEFLNSIIEIIREYTVGVLLYLLVPIFRAAKDWFRGFSQDDADIPPPSDTGEASSTDDGNQDPTDTSCVSTFPSLDGSPLSLFDQFWPISGVPVFELGQEKKISSPAEDRDNPSSTPMLSRRSISVPHENDPWAITACKFSFEGSRLVSGHNDGSVRLWDADHGQLLDCKKNVHKSPVADVAFRGNSFREVLSCDWLGTYHLWDKRRVPSGSHTVICTSIWKNRGFDDIQILFPKLIHHGNYVVFPVKGRVPPSGVNASTDVSEASVGASSIGPESGGADNYICTVLVFRTDDTEQLVASFCNIDVKFDFTLSCICENPVSSGLLIGLMNLDLTGGFLVFWPDYLEEPTKTITLAGTMGKWSAGGDMLAAWTVPADVIPEEGIGGVCFLFGRDWLETTAYKYMGLGMEQSYKKLWLEELEGQDPEDDDEYPKVLRCKKGENVLWCSFVTNSDGDSRLVSCNVSEGVRIVFWDVSALAIVYVIPLPEADLQCTLGSKEFWEERLSRQKWSQVVRGLDPLGISGDGTWLGLVHRSKTTEMGYTGFCDMATIWNANHAVKELRITLPRDLVKDVMDHKDIVLGPKPGKFAILCDRKILVAAPRSRSALSTQGALAVQLKYADRKHLDNFDYQPICKFSVDGCKLGLMHPYSKALHIWDLEGGVRLGPLLTPAGGLSRFYDYAFSPDGDHIVACMYDGALFLWSVSKALGLGEVSQVHVLPASAKAGQDGEPCKAIGFSSDEYGGQTVVVCDGLGSLWWFGVVDTTPRAEEATPPVKQPRDSWLEIVRKASRTDFLMHATWGVLGTVDSNALFSCKFAADGSVGVLMPNSQKAEVWDLVGRKILRTCNFQVHLGPMKPLPFPHNVAFSGDFALVGTGAAESKFVHCTTTSTYDDLKKQVCKVPRNMVVSEDGRWMLYDKLVKPQAKQNIPDMMINPAQYSRTTRLRSVDQLIIADTWGAIPELTLKGSSLRPDWLMAISPDGRKVACMKSDHTICIWSAYAVNGLIPDYELLKMDGNLYEKKIVKTMLDEVGVSILNYPGANGLSVLYHALLDEKTKLGGWCLKWALDNSIKVRIRDLGTGIQSVSNALSLMLQHKSSGSARLIVQYSMLGVAHESDLAEMICESLVNLGRAYPRIFLETLESSKMFLPVGIIQAPEFFLHRPFVVTTDSKLKGTREQMQENWDARLAWLRSKKGADKVTIPCSAQVLLYPNAALIGNRGILRDLLVGNSDRRAFQTMAIRVIIDYKWRLYGRHLLVSELGNYMLLLLFFTVYGGLLGRRSEENVGGPMATEDVFMALSAVLALTNLLKEFNQLYYYMEEYKWAGLYFWVTSGWNWIELATYTILVFLLPISRLLPGVVLSGRGISDVVAMTMILLWWKVLFYARAFEAIGPMVIMISEIIQDITYFLILASMVLFGFGMAFYVMFRNFRNSISVRDEMMETEDGAALLTQIDASFKGLGLTMLTLFGYLLGDFDTGILLVGPAYAVTIFLYLFFMISMTIILLNLLIAIMGDSFDRIKNTEEMEFLMARAKAIDDLESMMSSRMLKKLESRILPYVHVLVRKDFQMNSSTDLWPGRVKDLERRIRRALRASTKLTQEMWKNSRRELRTVKRLLLSMQGIDHEAGMDFEGQGSREWARMFSLTVPSSNDSTTSSTGISSLMEEQDADFMMSDSD